MHRATRSATPGGIGRFAVGLLVALLIAALPAVAAAEPADSPRGRQPGGGADQRSAAGRAPAAPGRPVAGQHIVVFHPGTQNPRGLAESMAREHGAELLHVYEHAIQGFAARVPDGRVEGLRRNRHVAYVEQDAVVTTAATQSPVTWGLDRIDQRDLPLSNSYTYDRDGSGVHLYVVDTGIRRSHSEFTGRIGNGFDAVTSGGTAEDCNGHGTHVAGTAGGTTYGVAKKVTLHAVRVLACNGSGTVSGVVAGVDWVRTNHVKPAVANMSLGGGASSTIDSAVANAIAAGVTFAVAAGNSSANACNYSPARVSTALTVGATTSTDARASYSNYGSCLDLFAPGSSITSAWHTSDTATNTINGTSMASPHVAGAAALHLSANPSATPAAVADALLTAATTGKVTSAGSGSPNRLLYVGASGSTPTPPPPSGNVLVNPGFESPSTGWTQSSSGGYALIDSARPRTGSYSAWLGGYNAATDHLYQRVTVPSGGRLSYWVRVESQEPSSTVYDTMEVRLYDGSSGGYLTTLRRWSNGSARNSWLSDSIDVSAYAGRSVYVSFYARTDSSYSTSFFVDDTALQ